MVGSLSSFNFSRLTGAWIIRLKYSTFATSLWIQYFRNFVTRLLLHYIDELICIKIHLINLPIEYSLAMFPVQITSNRLEGFAVVLLPPLRPGENLHLLDGLLSAVSLTDSLPVVLSFG